MGVQPSPSEGRVFFWPHGRFETYLFHGIFSSQQSPGALFQTTGCRFIRWLLGFGAVGAAARGHGAGAGLPGGAGGGGGRQPGPRGSAGLLMDHIRDRAIGANKLLRNVLTISMFDCA